MLRPYNIKAAQTRGTLPRFNIYGGPWGEHQKFIVAKRGRYGSIAYKPYLGPMVGYYSSHTYNFLDFSPYFVKLFWNCTIRTCIQCYQNNLYWLLISFWQYFFNDAEIMDPTSNAMFYMPCNDYFLKPEYWILLKSSVGFALFNRWGELSIRESTADLGHNSRTKFNNSMPVCSYLYWQN